ncbi:MAG: MerR family transcriptional regulator [Ancrocorticia sp.]|uniref:MerR family transcriptional regulator n=1 Tax=Ancrocorticia sp. TaxID=2593684 RepID=UPI003F8FFD4D
MAETLEPMSIGAFSSLTRLSVRMLRHYHERGVLVPALVDEIGHRWYTREQVADALLIRELRDVGFNVSAMAALLAARESPIFERALVTQRDALELEQRAATQRLQHIDRMLDSVRGNNMSKIEIERMTVPAMSVAAVRGTVPTYSDEGPLWERLMTELGRQRIVPLGPGGVFEHDPTFVDADPELSVFLPVAPGTVTEAPLDVFEVPEQKVVAAHLEGPYTQITEAHDRITTFIAENGLKEAVPDPAGVVGKVFNLYFNEPGDVDESELRTDVNRPLR